MVVFQVLSLTNIGRSIFFSGSGIKSELATRKSWRRDAELFFFSIFLHTEKKTHNSVRGLYYLHLVSMK